MLKIATFAAFLTSLSHQQVTGGVNTQNLDPLKFNKDGTFQLCVFNDFHFGEDEAGQGPERDNKTQTLMGDIIDFEEPDLVVLNGDLINGDTTYADNSTHYVDQVVAPMVERGMTWAATYGNHDYYYNINSSDTFEREQTFHGSRTDRMVDGERVGVTNYYLPVYGSDCSTGSDCTPELLLWFFDSRGGYYSVGNPRENWVDESVAEWFNETNAALVEQYQKEIPSLAFVHIPIHASYAIQQEYGINKNYHPGINEETVVQQGDGWCDEEDHSDGCEYGNQDLPFMQSLVSIPGVIGLFYGHDHSNTWCYKWDKLVPGTEVAGNGINLCYGQHTGYGGYSNWVRGGRQIVVTLDGLKEHTVDTYIRLETGEAVGAVSLNSTFNDDSYAVTSKQMTYLSDNVAFVSASSCVRCDRDLAFYVGTFALTLVAGIWLGA